MACAQTIPPQNLVARVLYYGLQPAILLAVIGVWLSQPTNPTLFVGCVLAVQLVLGVLEHLYPARAEWRLNGKQRSSSIVLVLILFFVAGAVGDFYTQVLDPFLSSLREQLGVHIWPHHWPLLVQMFAVFFLNELLWYWVHRAEHQWSVVWRFSGHGAHHAFQKLGALNFGLNHPLEYFFLLMPAALLELIFGIGAPALGASLLLVSQASIAHCNVAMNSRVIGWLFTTNQYHICHHSLDLAESNTNFGCAAIVWDRMFGTFSDNRAVAVGSGPVEPSTWHKLVMPIKEYEVSDIAPSSRR